MEIRNVQRTGKMHYLYLPTEWCRKHKITSETKVGLTEMNDGTILVSPQLQGKKHKIVQISLPAKYTGTLMNAIMACYVNPTQAFKIQLGKKADVKELLSKKALISGLEFVEIDGEHVTYEASMQVAEPDALLKTLVKKIRNLLYVMTEEHDDTIIQKYEEEIDRSKVLIQKSVISALVDNESTRLKAIELHYTMQMAIELERLVDHLIQIKEKDKIFLRQLQQVIDLIKDVLENIDELTTLKAAHFTQTVMEMPEPAKITGRNYHRARIKGYLMNLAEVIFDWSVTKLAQN
ncbi:hypothetical protein J4419_04065 [Candidatus Woesearchaeota archaeon]|nr:hypothetical protein [Candidatus Woesearchaeota archaeon]